MGDYAYHKRWKYDRAHGRMRTTAAAPVAEHVDALVLAGWSLRGIADAAGLSASTVHHVKARHNNGVRNVVAQRILAVRPESILARSCRTGFVLKIGAVRRIRALQAIGHRGADITAAMRAADPSLGTNAHIVVNQRGESIARSTHDAVCAAYAQLSMKPGASATTRRRAVQAGHAPPMAWDDDTIDDPDAQPEGVGADPIGRHRKLPPFEELQFLLEQGETKETIADRYDVPVQTVERQLYRKAAA